MYNINLKVILQEVKFFYGGVQYLVGPGWVIRPKFRWVGDSNLILCRPRHDLETCCGLQVLHSVYTFSTTVFFSFLWNSKQSNYFKLWKGQLHEIIFLKYLWTFWRYLFCGTLCFQAQHSIFLQFLIFKLFLYLCRC